MRREYRVVKPLLALLALLFLAGCGKGAPPAAPEEDKKPDEVAVQTALARTQAMDATVTAQGTLTPGQGANTRVASSVAGRLLAVNVREGDRVTAGQVVAMVDNRPLQAQSRSASAALSTAEAQARSASLAAQAAATDQTNSVRLASLQLQSAQLDRDNAVQQAQTALQAARTDLQKTQAGARPQEIALADQAVNQARATRDRAATEAQRVQFLFSKGVSAKRQLDDAQTALEVANAALASAQQQADLIRAGARPEDLRAAQIRVQQAQETLLQARTSGDAKIAQAQAALRQAQQAAAQVGVKQQDARAQLATAAQKRADFAAASAQAAYAEIHAPLSGIVARRALNPGDMADTTTPILEISNARALNLAANLTADEGQSVRAGMPAHITVEGLPNNAITGQVLSVGQIDPQTNLLAVRIAVPNPQGTLRAGAFATAQIVVQSHPRAVVVPKSAVLTKEGKQVVFVVDKDNVAHQKEVSVGVENENLAEILKGVASGEKVIVLGQYEIADGAKVKEAETKQADAGEADKGKPGAEKAGEP